MDCRTIAAMNDYVNRSQQPPEHEDRRALSNRLPAPPQRPRLEAGPAEHQRVISMITGGSSLGITSKRQRRAYVRQIHHVATWPASKSPQYTDKQQIGGTSSIDEDASDLELRNVGGDD